MLIKNSSSVFFVSSATGKGAFNKSANGADFAITYTPAVQIPDNAVNIYLTVPSSSINNSTLNVSVALKNNEFTFTDDIAVPEKYTVTIPDGRYSVYLLSEAINRGAGIASAAAVDVFSLSGNDATQKAILEIKKAGYQVNFKEFNSIRSLLGFNQQFIPASALQTLTDPIQTEADLIANFGTLRAFAIACSLASSSPVRLGDKASSVIALIPITAGPGSLNSHEPINVLKIPCNHLRGRPIDTVDFRLTDQDGVTLDTNGEDYSFPMVITYDLEPIVPTSFT